MRIRIAITILLAMAYMFGCRMLSLVYSPLTAMASANQLDDTVQSYATAKFIREGGLQSCAFYLFIFLLVLVWLSPLVNRNKQNKKTTNEQE